MGWLRATKVEFDGIVTFIKSSFTKEACKIWNMPSAPMNVQVCCGTSRNAVNFVVCKSGILICLSHWHFVCEIKHVSTLK